jgi:hypothetical protein
MYQILKCNNLIIANYYDISYNFDSILLAARGDETAYKAKLKPKEDGYYTVYVNLYDDHRNIARAYDMSYVAKS